MKDGYPSGKCILAKHKLKLHFGQLSQKVHYQETWMKDKDLLYVKDARSGNLLVPSSHKLHEELSQRKPCNKYIITTNLIKPTPTNLKVHHYPLC